MRILKIESLPGSKTWVDRDDIMFHACFQLLKDCVEKEHVDTHCDYQTHKELVDEIRFLYKWWIERQNPGKEESQDIQDILNQDEEDNEMLLRLMKIRRCLWT